MSDVRREGFGLAWQAGVVPASPSWKELPVFYAGDEYAPDEITSGPYDHDPMLDQYCDYCEEEGHTFRTCPQRDDYDTEDSVGG